MKFAFQCFHLFGAKVFSCVRFMGKIALQEFDRQLPDVGGCSPFKLRNGFFALFLNGKEDFFFLGDDLVSKFGEQHHSKIQVMYNGWDKADFAIMKHQPTSSDKYIISYLGSLYGKQSVAYFIKALKKLRISGNLPANLEIRFIGNFYRENLELLKSHELRDVIKLIPQVEHFKALELMQESDLLLLFLPSKLCKSVVMGKVFEYMRSGVEIMAMIPSDNETARLLKEFNYNNICPMEEVDKIAKMLQKCIKQKRVKREYRTELEKYSREKQVQQLGLRMEELK